MGAEAATDEQMCAAEDLGGLHVNLRPQRRGCAGERHVPVMRHCREPVAYQAQLTYCMCGEAPWSEHKHYGQGAEHAPDVESGVLVCASCAADLRTWDALTAMSSLRPTPSLT